MFLEEQWERLVKDYHQNADNPDYPNPYLLKYVDPELQQQYQQWLKQNDPYNAVRAGQEIENG